MQSETTPAPATLERLRLKKYNLRLGLETHTEGVVEQRYPISKCVGITFNGGKYAIVREDQLESIPPSEEQPEGKIIEVDSERVEAIGPEAYAKELIESESDAA